MYKRQGEAFAILRGYGRGLSLSRFAAESWAAVRVGFYADDRMVLAWFAFVAFCLSLIHICCRWLNARIDSLITGIRLGSTWFWVQQALCLWNEK